MCLAGADSFESHENGQQIQSLTIGGNSIEEYSIILPADTSYDDNIYFAAELLFEYIKKATDVGLTIEIGT